MSLASGEMDVDGCFTWVDLKLCDMPASMGNDGFHPEELRRIAAVTTKSLKMQARLHRTDQKELLLSPSNNAMFCVRDISHSTRDASEVKADVALRS